MKISKFATTTFVAGIATLALSSVAFASTADISGTGPGSTSQVTIDNSSHTEVSNDSNVVVTSVNTQTADTGSATVSDNTTGNSATTGAASNTSTVTTSINVGNQTGQNPGGGQGGGQGGGGQGGGSGSGDQAATTSNIGASGSGGLGGGSPTLSTGTLPETGASQPIDVSALRDYLSRVASQVHQAAEPKPSSSLAYTIVALTVSLMGAMGAAKLTAKRTLRV